MFSNDLFLCFCVVIINGMELFSQEILQPNFSIDSILDAIEDSDEPAPQNSCAEELKKIVPAKASRVDRKR